MAEEKTEVSIEGLSRLQSAARDFAKAESDRIVSAIICEFQSRPAEGIFGDVHARHFWDEYCWARQEGPFDEPTAIGGTNVGSISDAFGSMVEAHIRVEVEKLPMHSQIFLSACACETDPDSDAVELLGCIWIDGIVQFLVEVVNGRAAHRNLDLIGPNRGDAIGYEIEGGGVIWPALDRTLALDIIRDHFDEILDPGADLSPLADEIVDAFLMATREDADGSGLLECLMHFEERIRLMIKEMDVLASLEDMRSKLLRALDG